MKNMSSHPTSYGPVFDVAENVFINDSLNLASALLRVFFLYIVENKLRE